MQFFIPRIEMIFWLALLGCAPVYAQAQQIASPAFEEEQMGADRIEQLQEEARKFHPNHVDSSLMRLQEARTLAEQLGLTRQKAEILVHLGAVHVDVAALQEAQQYLLEALEITEQNQWDDLKTKALIGLARLSIQQQNFLEAERYYRQAIALSVVSNAPIAFRLQVELGNLYLARYESEKNGQLLDSSLVYYTKASEIAIAARDSLELCESFRLLSTVHGEMGNKEKAISNMQKALFISMTSAKAEKERTLTQLANLYLSFDEYDKAIRYYNEAFALAKQRNDLRTQCHLYYYMGQAEQQKGDTDKALLSLSKSLGIAHELGLRDWHLRNLIGLSNIYQQKKLYLQAYQTLSAALALKDSVLNEEKVRQMAQLQAAYESEKTAREISSLQQANTLQNLQMRAQRNQLLVLGLLVMILLLGGGLLIYLYREKNRTAAELEARNAEIELQAEKLMLANHDIREQKNQLSDQNRQLQQLNQEKNYLIGVVSHDLRNPLTVALSMTSLVRESSEVLDEDEQEALATAERSLHRMEQMIKKILDIKVIDSNKVHLTWEQTDMQQLTCQAIGHFTESLKLKKQRIKKELAELSAEVDNGYALQIIENLISNAIKFSPRESVIEVRLRQQEAYARWEVQDQGPGLTDDDQSKLFQQYQTLSARPTGNESSTGLGLSIVKKYVEAMGGQVGCISQKGQGAMFWVQLPLIQAEGMR